MPRDYDSKKIVYGTHRGKVVVVGSDHGGVDLKIEIIQALAAKNCTYIDAGVRTAYSVDYPDIAKDMASIMLDVEKQTRGELSSVAIGICKTGVGMQICLSRLGLYVAQNPLTISHAELARQHNNTNALALGADIDFKDDIADIVHAWLTTPFKGKCNDARHRRRLYKVQTIEQVF